MARTLFPSYLISHERRVAWAGMEVSPRDPAARGHRVGSEQPEASRMMNQAESVEMHPPRPQVWVVGGGKGGTGKSLVAASLGIHLTEMGRRVVLVDGDLGTPNLHTFLGLKAPAVGLVDVLRRDLPSLDAAAVDTGVPRLRLISGARNSLDVESLKHFQKTRLIRLLLGVSADVVVVDLGAGTSLGALDFFAIADRGLLVIQPEPTSIENCYRFLRAAFLRRLQQIGRTLGHQGIIDLVMRHRSRPGPGGQIGILEEIRRIDAFVAETLESHLEAFLPNLVLNQVRDHDDARLGESMQIAAERLVGIPLRFAGAIPYDPVLVRSVKRRRPYLVEYPRSRTAEAFRAVGERVATTPARSAMAPGLGGSAPLIDPHAVLELARGADQAEIVAAYMRLRQALRFDSPALVSLDCDLERRFALTEVEQAFRALSRNASAGEARFTDRVSPPWPDARHPRARPSCGPARSPAPWPGP